MNECDVIEGAYYRLNIERKDYSERWCKHDIVKAEIECGKFIFVDTYWASRSHSTVYKFEQVKDMLVFAIDCNYVKEVNDFEYDMYDDKDKLYIPIGGGSEKLLVDSRVEVNRDKVKELLEWQLSAYESNERIARNNHERIKGYLSDLDMAIENGIYK